MSGLISILPIRQTLTGLRVFALTATWTWNTLPHMLAKLVPFQPSSLSSNTSLSECPCYLSCPTPPLPIPSPGIFSFFINLFIYLFLAVLVLCCCTRLSLDAASGGGGLLFVAVRGLLLLRSTGSRCAGFSSCGSRASVVVACGLYSAGSVVVVHGLSCSTACGIFPDQGLNPCPLHWQVDS